MTDFAKLIDRAETAPEPLKRSVQRDSKPSPALPLLARSWNNRADKENGKVGESIRIRTYTATETKELYRALRRAADQHETLGVRIEAPHVMVDRTDSDGNVVEDANGDAKQRMEFRTGYLVFAAHPKQKRTRKSAEVEASTDAPEDDEDESDGTDEDGNVDAPQTENQPEPAWG